MCFSCHKIVNFKGVSLSLKNDFEKLISDSLHKFLSSEGDVISLYTMGLCELADLEIWWSKNTLTCDEISDISEKISLFLSGSATDLPGYKLINAEKLRLINPHFYDYVAGKGCSVYSYDS